MDTSPESEARPEHVMSIVEGLGRRFYSDLPYHNWQHALDTRLEALKLVSYCGENGVVADRLVVESAAILHDAGYAQFAASDQDHRSKEEYSASIAQRILTPVITNSGRLGHILETILSTRAGVPCETLEAKIVRRADLANLLDEFTLVRSTLLLLAEHQQLTGETLSPFTMASTSHELLEIYLQDDVSFGEFDNTPDGISRFTAIAKSNLYWLEPNRFSQLAKSVNLG